MIRILNVVRSAQDLLGLLDGVFNLTGEEERGHSSILIVVLGIAEGEAEPVVVHAGGIERLDRAVKELALNQA